MAQRKISRRFLGITTALVVGGALVWAMWPRPQLADMVTVRRDAMIVTIDEEGRTQVHDPYTVSTPISGRLLRVEVESGDAVIKGETVVARMLPSSPTALDIRTREQALANVTAANAGLRVAEADLNKARADVDLAESNLARTRKLFASGIASQAALDNDARSARAAAAALDITRAAISMRVAQLNNAQAQLISFDDPGLAAAAGANGEKAIPLYAPSDGAILRVLQQSETNLPIGTPIVEIGNIRDDLEVLVELLSTDAVRVMPGNTVLIDNWGGADTLNGTVHRVEPWGFTKFSALGVEEQRVRVSVRFTDPPEARANMGHGFRVQTRIVIWQRADALVVPATSLFRQGNDWTVFVVQNGTVQSRTVTVEANNGRMASITDGLAADDVIVQYPSASLTDGARVARRDTN
jgi:HlyD family secretion protein